MLKRNDQRNPFNPNAGAKNMTPIGWWDEFRDGPFILEPWMLQSQAYLHLEVKRDLIPWLRWACDTPEKSNIPLRYSRVFFDEEKLQKKIKDPDFISKCRSPHALGIYDATAIDLKKHIKYSLEHDWEGIPALHDWKAISSGTYTIGAGKDYSTYNAFVADITTQTGNLTGRVDGSSTISSNTFMSHDMANFDITIDSANAHGGDQTAADVLTVDHNNNGINMTTLMSNEGTVTITGFRINRSTAGSSSAKLGIIGSNYTGEMIIHHMFVDGGGLAGSGISADNQTPVHKVYSNLIWDCNDYGFWGPGTAAGSMEVEIEYTIMNF